MSKTKLTLLATVLILLVILAFRAGFNWSLRSWYGYETNRDTRYSAFLGCMVKIENRWIPRNELRVVQ